MTRQWLDQVERELANRGLPQRQTQRLVSELRDHISDIEGTTIDGFPPADEAICDQLGRPNELAQAAWENHLATNYAARHPLVAFLVLPIPLVLFGWTAAVAAMIGVFHAADNMPWIAAHVGSQPLANWPTTILCFVPFLEMSVRLLPPVVVAILCNLWAEQLRQSRKWRFLACVAIAIAAGLLHSTLVLPPAPGQGRWAIGFGAPGGRDQLLQLLIPLLIALWWTCRSESNVGCVRDAPQ